MIITSRPGPAKRLVWDVLDVVGSGHKLGSGLALAGTGWREDAATGQASHSTYHRCGIQDVVHLWQAVKMWCAVSAKDQCRCRKQAGQVCLVYVA
jgi:hypothetical protein